jgi:hypothetical protein
VLNHAGRILSTTSALLSTVGQPGGTLSMQGSVTPTSLGKCTFQVAVVGTNIKHAVTHTRVAIRQSTGLKRDSVWVHGRPVRFATAGDAQQAAARHFYHVKSRGRYED